MVLSRLALAQEIEKDIEAALTPVGPFIPQSFPWDQIVLAVGICAGAVFFFMIFLPKVASSTLRFGKVVSLLIAVLLSVFLPFTLYALRSPTKILLEAAPGSVPKSVSVVAVTADSFTVEWKTQAEAVGVVKYGSDPAQLNFFALDERGNILTTVHRVLVKNLKPETKYYFEVVSGQLRFNDDGQPLEVETL